MLSELQRTLAEQTRTTLDRLDARRLLTDPQAQAFAENLELAIEAMQPAAEDLLAVDLDNSVPNQQTALQHLLRAEAQFRDIQVVIQQEGQQGGGGGGAQRDLAEIYELEMDLSRNQYETRQSPSLQQPEEAIEDAFDQLEELSRRQEALAEQARRNNELSLSERWEQEQLTREAQELQQELERLEQQRQQNAQQNGEQGGEQTSASQQAATEALQQNLQEIIENMQQASSGQSANQNGEQADSASAASEQLRDTLDQLNEARQQLFRDSISDIAERTEQLQEQQEIAAAQLEEALSRAMEERRDTGDYISGLTGQQEAELSELKRQMAEEVGDISGQLESLVESYSEQLPISSSALREASNILAEERLQGNLAEAAEAIEYGLAPQVSVREFAVTDALQRLRDQAEFAAGTAESELLRDRPETGPTAAEQIARLREQLERNLQAPGENGEPGDNGEATAQQGQNQGQGQQQGGGQQAGQPGDGNATGVAGQVGGNQAGVARGGANITPLGGRTDLGSDFDFVGSTPPPLNTNDINEQATEAAGQILALSNLLIQQGLSDEEIIQAQQLARQLAAETGDPERIADSLRALIGQLEKLELGLNTEAQNGINLELRSGAGGNSQEDDDVAEYFRNLSELPVR